MLLVIFQGMFFIHGPFSNGNIDVNLSDFIRHEGHMACSCGKNNVSVGLYHLVMYVLDRSTVRFT